MHNGLYIEVQLFSGYKTPRILSAKTHVGKFSPKTAISHKQ